MNKTIISYFIQVSYLGCKIQSGVKCKTGVGLGEGGGFDEVDNMRKLAIANYKIIAKYISKSMFFLFILFYLLF